jgi:hypothetical protein
MAATRHLRAYMKTPRQTCIRCTSPMQRPRHLAYRERSAVRICFHRRSLRSREPAKTRPPGGTRSPPSRHPRHCASTRRSHRHGYRKRPAAATRSDLLRKPWQAQASRAWHPPTEPPSRSAPRTQVQRPIHVERSPSAQDQDTDRRLRMPISRNDPEKWTASSIATSSKARKLRVSPPPARESYPANRTSPNRMGLINLSGTIVAPRPTRGRHALRCRPCAR